MLREDFGSVLLLLKERCKERKKERMKEVTASYDHDIIMNMDCN